MERQPITALELEAARRREVLAPAARPTHRTAEAESFGLAGREPAGSAGAPRAARGRSVRELLGLAPVRA